MCPAGRTETWGAHQLGAPAHDGGLLVVLIRELLDALEDTVGVGNGHTAVVLATNGVVQEALGIISQQLIPRGQGQFNARARSIPARQQGIR